MPDVFSRVLGDGTLPTARQTLYRCPARTRALVTGMTLVNLVSQDVTVNVYLNTTGIPRRIISRDLIIKKNRLIELDLGYALEPDDLLEGDATQADAVDYTISGKEER